MCKRYIASLTAIAILTFTVSVGHVKAALPDSSSFSQSGSIVSKWNLDETSGTRADSVSTNTLADNNTVPATDGISEANASAESAADHSRGSSEFLSKTDNAALSPTGDLGFGVWMYADSVPTSGQIHGIMGKSGGGSNRAFYFGLYNASGTPKLLFANSAAGSADVLTSVDWTPSTATWYYVTVVYDASAGEVDFYVNGAAQGATAGSANTSLFDSTADFTIGTALTDYWDGRLQDAILWTGVELSAEEVLVNYQVYTVVSGGGGGGSAMGVFFSFYSDKNTYA